MASDLVGSLFLKIRKLLDDNAYKETLPPEAVPLVHHLIQDIVLKNKQLKEATSSLKECKEKCEALNVSVDPLREENGRALTKLNKLHMENLTLREHNEKLIKDIENSTRQLEIEKEDLEFLIGQLKRKIESVEDVSRKKSDTILQLQEKNLKAVIVTPGGSKRPFAFQKQRMEISSPLKSAMASTAVKCETCGCASEGVRSRNKDVYMADLLKITDKKILSLQEEVEIHKDNALRWKETCNELKKKIEVRDAEISRLQMLLEGGRPISAILEDNQITAAHSKLHQLQLENDVLTQRNNHLELKLKSLLGETHDAMNLAMAMEVENKDLTAELQSAASSNRILKKDRDCATETLSIKLARHKEKLKDCEGDLVEQHTLYHVAKDERDGLKRDLGLLNHMHSCLKGDLAHAKEELILLSESNIQLKEERKHLEEVLARGQGERKMMADRINSLTVQVQELEMERTSLQSQTNGLRSNIATLEKAKVEAEASDSFYKKETEKLGEEKQALDVEKAYLKSEISQLRTSKAQLEEEKSYYREQAKEFEEKKASIEGERDTVREKYMELQREEPKIRSQVSELSAEKENIERERDNYSEQVVQLLDLLKVKPALGTTDPTRRKLSPEEELQRVTYERDLIKQELDFYKTQVKSLQSQLEKLRKVVAQESASLDGSKVVEGDTDTEDIEKVKSQRNFFEAQTKHYQHLYNEMKMKLLQQKSPPAVSPSASMSPAGGLVDLTQVRHELQVCEQEREFFREQYERLKLSLLKPPSDAEVADVGNLLRERDMLKEERDFYRLQYKDLTVKMSQVALEPPSARELGLKQELKKIICEKRAIALSKAQVDAKLVNMRDDLRDLERENHALTIQKMDMSKGIINLENVALQKFPSMQNFIADIRKSREDAFDEVEKLKNERDMLRSKVKVLSAEQIKERVLTEEDLRAVQMQKEESDAASADLRQRVRVEADLIESLQNQMETLQQALQHTQAELLKSSSEAAELRKLLEEKVGETTNQDQELERRSNKLTSAQAKIADLAREVEELQKEVTQLSQDGKVLKSSVKKIDNEKDALVAELDSKSEFVETLKKELKKEATQIGQLEGKIAKMQASVDAYEEELEVERKKVVEEVERSDRLQQDLAVISEQKDVASKEVRRIQKEIIGQANDTKEVRAELEHTLASRENFKLKAQEYCRTLETLNETIATKDKEQDALMQDYLTLNDAVTSLKNKNASLEESAATQTQHMSRLEEMVKKAKEDREALVCQMNDAMTKVDVFEKKLHTLEEEKFNLENDLIANRDLAQKVETRRSEADSEARRLTAACEKAMEERRVLERELESMARQLASERSAFKSLEEILSEKRKAEFVAESTAKQLEVEKSQLQRKLAEFSSEMESDASEGKRLRTSLATLEMDVERMKRQLTNEQYERERLEQELRRVRKYSQISDALSTLTEWSDCDEGALRHPPVTLTHSYSPSHIASRSARQAGYSPTPSRNTPQNMQLTPMHAEVNRFSPLYISIEDPTSGTPGISAAYNEHRNEHHTRSERNSRESAVYPSRTTMEEARERLNPATPPLYGVTESQINSTYPVLSRSINGSGRSIHRVLGVDLAANHEPSAKSNTFIRSPAVRSNSQSIHSSFQSSSLSSSRSRSPTENSRSHLLQPTNINSLQHIQTFLKPSFTHVKTFYSSLPDAFGGERVVNGDDKSSPANAVGNRMVTNCIDRLDKSPPKAVAGREVANGYEPPITALRDLDKQNHIP